MATIAYKRKYRIHEAIGAASLNESYMISDSENGCGLAAVEEVAGIGVKIAKAFIDKSVLPVHMEMTSSEGSTILDMYQPISFIKPTFTVKTSDGRILCVIRKNSYGLKPNIDVLDERDQIVGTITGDWRFNNFDFKDVGGRQIATIKHCFGGVIRELFTTADDYEVDMLAETPDTSMAQVVLAAAIAIDIWYHE